MATNYLNEPPRTKSPRFRKVLSDHFIRGQYTQFASQIAKDHGFRRSENKNLKDREKIDVVDKEGKVLSQATRSEVYQKGLLHPAVNIVLINSKGDLFIQRRGPKKILALCWDISASEHVKSGESYQNAAIRGLKEELSITAPLKLLRRKHIQRNEYISKKVCLIEYELVELYGAVYDGSVVVNQEEVSEGRFISFEELGKLIKNGDTTFSPWGLEEINYLLANPSVISELKSSFRLSS